MLSVNILYVFVCLGSILGYLRAEEEVVQIQTQNGALQGKLQKLENGRSIYHFLGIPYAKPPVGDLRFRDPVPYKKWKGVLKATQFGPSCVEMTLRQTSYSVFGQEDCLYLNVFTPKSPKTTDELLPVMFWIYGGSFREGSSMLYGPDYLMREEVVLVTFNYRLGFFGFLSTQDKNAPGNYGIKDIVLALKWVKQNIIKFGGDPQNITIFGESAGGVIVGYLMLASQTKGLYNAAIMSSGTPLCSWGFHQNARKVAFDLGLAVGITTNSSSKLVNYLRNVDLPNAHQAMIRVNIINFLEVFDNGGPFGPVLEAESPSAIITKDSYKAFKNGDFNRVPVLMGVNSQESKYFNSLLPLMRPGFFLYDISPSSIVRTSMNVKSSGDKRTIGSKIRQYYFSSGSFLGGNITEFAEFFSDDLFVRPIAKTAQFLSRYIPVYFYVFDFEGNMGRAWLNYAASYNRLVKGVAHGTDLWYLWKARWYNQNLKSAAEQLTSERLVTLWTNFATFKNPTPNVINSADVHWPKVKSPDVYYYHISKDIKVGKNFKATNLKFWDSLYANYSNGPLHTY